MGPGSVIEAGDVPLQVVETPGMRPDHVAYVVGERPGGFGRPRVGGVPRSRLAGRAVPARGSGAEAGRYMYNSNF